MNYKIMSGLALLLFSSMINAQECKSNMPESTPTARFIDQNSGTVLDSQTELVWKRCSEGLSWDVDSSTCTGTRMSYTWQEALNHVQMLNAGDGFAGQTDWRVPNVKELDSILSLHCINPSINVQVFPEVPERSFIFWSSTPTSISNNEVWVVDFSRAHVHRTIKSYTKNIRLVRDWNDKSTTNSLPSFIKLVAESNWQPDSLSDPEIQDNFTVISEIKLFDNTGNELDQGLWSLVAVDSEEVIEEDGQGANAFDGDISTFWHTQWGEHQPDPPHHIIINLNGSYNVTKLSYKARLDYPNGHIKNYRIFTSSDNVNWTEVKQGVFGDNTSFQDADWGDNCSECTVYEDAEDRTIDGWVILPGGSSWAWISNDADPVKGRVITFHGYKSRTGFKLGDHAGQPDAWNNTEQKTISWDMKYPTKYFSIKITVDTPLGQRTLYYSATGENELHATFSYGIGRDATNGQWHTFTRDLEADLKASEPNNEILSVNGFIIYGVGSVDNIKLKK